MQQIRLIFTRSPIDTLNPQSSALLFDLTWLRVQVKNLLWL